MQRISDIEFIVTQNKTYVVIDGIKQESEKIVGDDARLLWAQLVFDAAGLKASTPEPEESEERCLARCEIADSRIFNLVAGSQCLLKRGHSILRNGVGHSFPEPEPGPTY